MHRLAAARALNHGCMIVDIEQATAAAFDGHRIWLRFVCLQAVFDTALDRALFAQSRSWRRAATLFAAHRIASTV